MTISYLKLIKYSVLILILFFWYYNTHHYIDIANGCNIKIKTSLFEFSGPNIKEALTALKHASPNRYYTVCKNINTISPGMSCGGWQGGCHYGNKTGEIWLSTTNDEFLGWTAAVITHETCHDIQMREKRPMSEDECYKVSHDTLTELVQYK